MTASTGSASLEVRLSRSKFLSLVKRLGDSSVTLNVARGRLTADGVWMLLELTGQKSRLNEALRLCRPTP